MFVGNSEQQINLRRVQAVPAIVSVSFMLIAAATVCLFCKSAGGSMRVVYILLAWMTLQMLVALSGFYENMKSMPPRFTLLILPPLVVIAWLFATARGREFIDSLDVRWLTILHVVRIPVELVLFALFVYRVVPQLMTFEGRNFDIVAGLSSPAIYFMAFRVNMIGSGRLIIWNILGIALLVNIVIHAILSAPSPFQQFAFDQPNIAIVHFPFVWLPCCIVPLVLFSHLSAIRILIKQPFGTSKA